LSARSASASSDAFECVRVEQRKLDAGQSSVDRQNTRFAYFACPSSTPNATEARRLRTLCERLVNTMGRNDSSSRGLERSFERLGTARVHYRHPDART